MLASIALRVFTGAAIPTTEIKSALGTKAGDALSEFVKEGLASGVEAMASVAGERLEDQPILEVTTFCGCFRCIVLGTVANPLKTQFARLTLTNVLRKGGSVLRKRAPVCGASCSTQTRRCEHAPVLSTVSGFVH